MDILNKLGALRKKKTPRIIDDVEFNFYPVRVARILTGDMKDVLTPITDAVQVLLQPKNADMEILEEVTPDGTIARATKPVSPEMARFRAEKKAAAIKGAMDTIFADGTRYKISRIIMDSLRDDCPKDPTEDQVKEFADADNMDSTVFVEFVKGMLAANTAIFGDLGNLISERVKKAMEKMSSPDEDQENNDAPDQPQQAPETEATAAETLDEESRVPTT